METESIKRTQTKGILEIENLGKQTGINRRKHHQQNTRDGGEYLKCRRNDRRNWYTGQRKY